MTISILNRATQPTQYTINLDQPVLIALNHLACYLVGGEDAASFLQGQFSNDINAVTLDQGQITSYCTPKGRMLAVFYICKNDSGYYLLTSKDIAEEVIKRLQMYVLRSKVTIKSCQNTIIMGVCNDNGHTVLNTLGINPPQNPYDASSNEDAVCLNIPAPNPRYLLIGNASLANNLQSISNNDVYIFDESYWQWLDIMAGLPHITSNTQEEFVPQMANMELINGVNFKKGCYPGQEVVARLHYLGNANRRMFRLDINAREAINAGDDIYNRDSDQPVGKVLSLIQESDNKYSALGVLRIEAVKTNQLVTGSSKNNSVIVMSLPYDLPIEQKAKEN